jgi:hypothetical protein
MVVASNLIYAVSLCPLGTLTLVTNSVKKIIHQLIPPSFFTQRMKNPKAKHPIHVAKMPPT